MFDPGTPIATFSTWVVRGLGEFVIVVIYRQIKQDFRLNFNQTFHLHLAVYSNFAI